MPSMKRCLQVLLIAILAGASVGARPEVEVIPLKYRSAEQIIPMLRPLIEPGGALTGMQYQLIVRASAANIADIRRVLGSLDSMPRRLLISVRQDTDNSGVAREASVSGNVTSGAGSGINARVFNSRSSSDDRVTQTVQVMEGGVAMIQMGQSIPIPARSVTRTVNGVMVTDSTAYRDVGTGFQVTPQVSGELVTLAISPQRDTPGQAGTFNVQRAATTVSGRLGEWIALGGIDSSDTRSGSGILSSSSAQRSDNRSIWVKVEELK